MKPEHKIDIDRLASAVVIAILSDGSAHFRVGSGIGIGYGRPLFFPSSKGCA